MELQETALTSVERTPPFASWFDYLSLESFLGCGSFGCVFKAVSGAQTHSAVKIIFMDAIGKSEEESTQEKNRVSREYQLIRDKEHENLVTILKATETTLTLADFEHMQSLNCLIGNEDAAELIETQYNRARRGRPIFSFCMQMELCGKTLRQWLNVQVVDNPELSPIKNEIIHGLASGLSYLHDNNVMHRDFRPENIMFTYSPTEEFALPIKIGDFGLCRKVHSQQSKTSTLTTKVGNESYRAPETVGSDYGKQADIFSFGLVVWEVAQLIRYKDMPSMFYKLVHQSKTNLVKIKQVSLRNTIISLTKRRLQDRATAIPKYLNRAYNEGLIIVDNDDEFHRVVKACKAGDVIELVNFSNWPKFSGIKWITLNTDNVTIYSKEEPNREILFRLDITGKGCTIKGLTFVELYVLGNDNIISKCGSRFLKVDGKNNLVKECVFERNVVRPKFPVYVRTTYKIKISGNDNFMEKCTMVGSTVPGGIEVLGSGNKFVATNLVEMEKLGFVVSGSNNVFENLTTTPNLQTNDKLTISEQGTTAPSKLGICLESEELLGMRPLSLITTPSSFSCSIIEGNLCYAFISGSQHTLRTVKLRNTLKLIGIGHKINNCNGTQLHNESKNSQVDFLKLDLE